MADHFRTAPVSIAQADIAPPHVKPLSRCGRCGWTFKIDNEVLREFDIHGKPGKKRKEPRSEINIPGPGGPIVRCTPCYELELWHAGKHTKQSPEHAGSDLYREALKP